TDKAYNISYARKFEPWFMAGRQVVPWHDARLRGYGHNKIIQVAATNATGVLFNVHPAAFLIHRPHARSTARGELNEDASDYRRLLRAVVRNVTGTLLQELQDAESQQQQQQILSQQIAESSPHGAFETAQQQQQQQRRQQGQGRERPLPPPPPQQQPQTRRHIADGRGLLAANFQASAVKKADENGDMNRNAWVTALDTSTTTKPPFDVWELTENMSSDTLLGTEASRTESSSSTEGSVAINLEGMEQRPWKQRKLHGHPQELQQQQQQQQQAPSKTAHPTVTTLSPEMQVIARKRAEAIIHDKYQDKMRYNIFWTNLQVYKDARVAMKTLSYVPVLDPSTEYCLGVLPWWNNGQEQQ
ncbi:hypothetical protein Vretimale_4024, partial [Volvox reticuliferus]